MPYRDPEKKKAYERGRREKQEVLERNRETYRKRYAENANGLADKVKQVHHTRWADPEYRAAKRRQMVARWETDWEGQAITQVRSRARKRGIPFDLVRGDIPLPEKCPIFGTPLVKGVGRLSNDSPSIDRIDPKRGYVRGNVVVVSMRANSIKREATIDDLRKMVAFYESLTEEDPND